MAVFGWMDLFEIVQALSLYETKANPTSCLQKRDQTLIWDCKLSTVNAYARIGQARILQNGSNWVVQTEGEGLSIYITVGKKYLGAHQSFKLDLVQGENNVFQVKMNSFLSVDFVNGLMVQKNHLQWNMTGSLILKELPWSLQQAEVTFLLSKSFVPLQSETGSVSSDEVSGDQSAEVVADSKEKWSLVHQEDVELGSCGIPTGRFKFAQEQKGSFFIVSNEKEGFFEVTQKKIKNPWVVCKEPLYGFMVLRRPWLRFLLNYY